MGIASLVLGIISVVFFWMGAAWWPLILGIVGIILGAVGKIKNAKCAVAGLVLSIIGTALGLLAFIACGGCALCGLAMGGLV